MILVKKIILYLFGILLLVFGNKTAISKIFGAESEKNNTVEETNKKEKSTMFGSIEVGELKDTKHESADTKTTIESDEAENASASQ